jgi:exonuclease VII small subunit
MKLVKYCSSRIDLVEKKVMKLSADGSLSEFEGMQDK